MNNNFLVPMSISPSKITNKNYDYRDIAFIQCHATFEAMIGDNYINHNILDFEGFNLKDNSTFRKRISRMLKIKDSIISLDKEDCNIKYKISFAKEGEKFVAIPYPILKKLIRETKSNVIKTYCFLAYELKDKPKQLTQEYIANNIGVADPKTIRRIVKYLEDEGLIKRELLPITVGVNKGNNLRTSCSTKQYKYSLMKLNIL